MILDVVIDLNRPVATKIVYVVFVGEAPPEPGLPGWPRLTTSPPKLLARINGSFNGSEQGVEFAPRTFSV
jgi:hypothetical protein